MTIDVDAIVVSGRGIAAEGQDNDVAALSDLLGTKLVSGSLNLVARKPLWLNAQAAILTTEEGHLYWRATLDDYPVIINRWQGGCPAHVYEIYADKRLRKKLELNDGDHVCLSLDKSDVDNGKSFLCVLSWFLTWFLREDMYYKNDKYLHWVTHKPVSKFTWRAMQM